jgi:hypothetical protein
MSSFLWAEVSSIKTESGIHNYSDRFRPFVRLVIKPLDGTRRPIYVNLKVMKRSTLRELKETLRAELPGSVAQRLSRNCEVPSQHEK